MVPFMKLDLPNRIAWFRISKSIDAVAVGAGETDKEAIREQLKEIRKRRKTDKRLRPEQL